MMIEQKNEDVKVGLKKSINLYTGCSISIGIIVGSGIFITPTSVLENTGAPGLSLAVWLFAGLISLIGAICFTELGTLIQKPGGVYAYINEAYGHMTAFLYIWMMLIICLPSLNAIAAITLSMYVVQIFFQNCVAPDIVTKLIAFLIIFLLGIINSLNAKLVSKLNMLFTITKIFAIVVVVFSGFWAFYNSSIKTSEVVDSWFPKTIPNFSKAALAIYSALFAFSGWNSLNFLTEEMKNPIKNLPRAVYISIPTVVIIYLIINTAFFIVLSPEEILKSETVALTFSEKIFPLTLAWLTPVLIAFSTFGALSGSILLTSRIYYAAACDGNLPEVFSLIHIKNHTPIIAIFSTVITSSLLLLIDNLNTLILYGTFSEFLFTGIAISSIFYLRYKQPNAKRPIKVFIIFPIIFMLILIFLILLTAIQNPKETLIGFLFLLLGIPFYLIFIQWKNKPKKIINASNKLTILFQKLFLCAKED